MQVPVEIAFRHCEVSEEIYFHRNAVLDGAFDRLSIVSEVAFVEEEGEKGPQASTIRLIGKHHLGQRMAQWRIAITRSHLRSTRRGRADCALVQRRGYP